MAYNQIDKSLPEPMLNQFNGVYMHHEPLIS